MPFFLYHRTNSGCLAQKARVQLAGREGLIHKAWQKLGRPAGGWHATLDDLISVLPENLRVPGASICSHLAPGRKRTIELLELRDIYGFTYPTWTPVMLKLTFYEWSFPQDLTDKDIASFLGLICELPEGYDVVEFLYLHGETGGWKWGPVGSVNAPLLFPDAWHYFKSQF